MAGPNALKLAHNLAVELQNASEELWSLLELLERGMPANDPRIDGLTPLRARLRDGLECAEADLVPQLGEFACIHEWPVEISGFTATSGHQASLKLAAWLVERKWTPDVFRKFFERFYDAEKKQIEWDAVREAQDKTFESTYELRYRHDWAEHAALLEMEYAKASKLATNPTADIPKLVNIEVCVLKALGNEVMTGPEIARTAGYPYNSNLKSRLARMCEKGLLEKVPGQGYRRGPLAPPA